MSLDDLKKIVSLNSGDTTENTSSCIKLYSECLVDIDKEYPESETIIKFLGKDVGMLSEILSVTGKSKSCKSLLASRIIMSMLNFNLVQDMDCLGFWAKVVPKNGVIVLLDTENGKRRISKRIRSMRNIILNSGQNFDKEKIDILDLRAYTVAERIELLEFLPKIYERQNKFIYLLVIDGILDFVNHMNVDDCINFSTKLVNFTAKVNCCTVAVIHQNDKTGKNTDTFGGYGTGHAGSFLTRKCTGQISVNKNHDDDTYKVRLEIARDEVAERDSWLEFKYKKATKEWATTNKNYGNFTEKTQIEQDEEDLVFLYKTYKKIEYKNQLMLIADLLRTNIANSEPAAKRLINRYIETQLITKTAYSTYKINCIVPF